MNTYIIDKLFEKYTLYASKLLFKDSTEANENETDESKNNFGLLVKNLSDMDYFLYLSKGDIETSKAILIKCESKYTELNPYYIKLKNESDLSYYELRISNHLSIIEKNNIDTDLSLLEIKKFHSIYSEELDYYLNCYHKYDSSSEILYNRLSILFMLFSTIIRLIKIDQSLEITDQNVNEYYLNNFLVSNGFLLYNNIDYHKKKIFTKHIIEYHNSRGSLSNIKNIVDVLVDNNSDIYEYYLMYDESIDKYSFIKVKPGETFAKVINENRNNREENFDYITSMDPSWIATESDLKNKNIKFAKTKYFSISYSSDLSSSFFELSLLLNNSKRVKELFGEIYKIDINGFDNGIEIVDYLLLINLMSFRVSGYKIDDIKLLKLNENFDNFVYIPKSWCNNKIHKQNSRQNLITTSINDINHIEDTYNNIYEIKKQSTMDMSLTPIDKIRELKKNLKDNYEVEYKYYEQNSNYISVYSYLTSKYPSVSNILEEEDLSLLSKNYLDYVNDLERILMTYGQSAFKFKEIYSNLYLPKIKEVINYFKSLNSYLIDFSTTLSIEKESKLDIISDSHSISGIVMISNKNSFIGSNSGNIDYNQDSDFINKEFIVDDEIDMMNEIINSDKFDEKNIIKNGNVKVVEYPINIKNKEKLLYSSFSSYMPFITDYSDVFDKNKRLNDIISNNRFFYFNGSVIDFFGQEGSYKKLREKYGLSYFDFKNKVSNILLKHNGIYGSVNNVIGIEKNDFIYDKNRKLPFLKKPYLFKRMNNKVEPGDILYRKLLDNTQYTDVVSVYEFNKSTNKFEHNPYYTDKYRSINYSYKLDKEYTKKYSGLRSFKEFINNVKDRKNNEIQEDNVIGSIPIPDYNN